MKHAKHSPAMKKMMSRRGTPARPMSGAMGGMLKGRAASAARKGNRGIAKRLSKRGK